MAAGVCNSLRPDRTQRGLLTSIADSNVSTGPTQPEVCEFVQGHILLIKSMFYKRLNMISMQMDLKKIHGNGEHSQCMYSV